MCVPLRDELCKYIIWGGGVGNINQREQEEGEGDKNKKFIHK